MNKHTPTPWRIGKGHCVVADEPVPGMGGSDAIEYYGGHLIAESITTENCEHIVRCVNSHEALLEYYRAAESFAFTSGHEDATVEQERAAEERFERAGDAVRKLMRDGLLAAAGAQQ